MGLFFGLSTKPLIVIITLILYNTAHVQRRALEHLSARRPRELIAIYTAPAANFMGYLDRKEYVILDEDSELLWIGGSHEALDAIPIRRMPEQPSTRRSVLLARHRQFGTLQGDLTHVSSPDDGNTFHWRGAGERNKRELAPCRPQDFTFNREEGNRLTVTPKERVLYCIGRTRTGRITAVTTVADHDLASAEIFTGRGLRHLQRKMAYDISAVGSRVEARIGPDILQCSKDGMLLGGKALRMQNPESYDLKINNQAGTARLIRL